MEKTEDSLFDEITETKIAPDGTLETRLVEDPMQEMVAAVAEMQQSWKEFCAVADSPIAAHRYEWWKALMWLSCAENRLKEAFCGRDRSPKSIAQFHRWRISIIYNRPYRSNV